MEERTRNLSSIVAAQSSLFSHRKLFCLFEVLQTMADGESGENTEGINEKFGLTFRDSVEISIIIAGIKTIPPSSWLSIH